MWLNPDRLRWREVEEWRLPNGSGRPAARLRVLAFR